MTYCPNIHCSGRVFGLMGFGGFCVLSQGAMGISGYREL